MCIPTSVVRSLPRLYLDYGTDEAVAEHLDIQERGVIFESRWKFEPMSELTVCLAWQHERNGSLRVPVQGVVIESRQAGHSSYETTVLFLDPDPGLEQGVIEFARPKQAR